MSRILDGTGTNNVVRFALGIRELTYPKNLTLKMVGCTDVAELVPHEPMPWTGEGLPPVGMVCEIGCADTWTECLIIAHHQHAGVGRAIYTYLLPGAGIEVNWCIAAGFRPIRTPEQIEAEERENAIKGMIADTNILTGIMSDRRIMAGQLYDSGYRKQVQP
ncbi:MAG TPA: hypothetical protein K8W20_22395 [Pseudomonas lactis]|uniref:Uncharacterized protein n=1 Tax=Pseudomonas lactis TaxID=1615674 RepID=A0A921NLS2_9PSED|nr:hypothetical protein [Pseudomonas lactis]HJH21440.1 hypothetical protein [Pseudomonas lactis]